MEFTEFNGVKVKGDVIAVSKSGFTIMCKNQSGERVFENPFEMACPAKKQPSWLKVGTRAECQGTLIKRRDEPMINVLQVKEASDEEYLSIGKIIGKIAYSFYPYDATPEKSAFGNLPVRIGKLDFYAVLLGALATVFGRTAKKGMWVQVQGPLRFREFDTKAGDTRKQYEIVADSDWTKLLSTKVEDEFADFGEPDDAPLEEAAAF